MVSRRWSIPCATALGFLLAACGSTARNEGVSRIDVRESKSALEVVGYDEHNAVMGRVSLRIGTFAMQEDGRVVDGRQMTMEAEGHSATHESEGFRDLHLPKIAGDNRVIDRFVRDPLVRPVLAKWGVNFQDLPTQVAAAPVTREARYSSCSYGIPSSCAATSCSEGSNYYEYIPQYTSCYAAAVEDLCCSADHSARSRVCGMGSLNVCGTEGPNGCAPCSTAYYSGSCSTSSSWYSGNACCDVYGCYPGGPYEVPTISYD
jgi:hypothetical protein